jgi:hypothetical protein
MTNIDDTISNFNQSGNNWASNEEADRTGLSVVRVFGTKGGLT